jgi:hypothetical protein
MACPAGRRKRGIRSAFRFHLWTEISARKRFIPANGDRSLTPNLEPVPRGNTQVIDYKHVCCRAAFHLKYSTRRFSRNIQNSGN